VILLQCPDCTAECLSCPELEMSGPASELEYGQIYAAGADIRGGPQDELTIKWTISAGEIVEGQGTPMVSFRIRRNSLDKEITIRYEIGLDPLCATFCPTSFSRTYTIQRDENEPKPVGDSLELSRTTVSLPCPAGCASREGSCKEDRTINVKVPISSPKSENVSYKYSVSAGKIVGSGPEVVWDLSDVKPGKYKILASAVNPAVKFSTPLKADVIVQECPDCLCDVECPSISVLGPAREVVAGESMVFTAHVSGGSQDTLTYHWKVSEGFIASGQGTPSITVSTTRRMAGRKITATIDISRTPHQVAHGCPYEESETVIIN